MDCSLPGSSLHGILQALSLENMYLKLWTPPLSTAPPSRGIPVRKDLDQQPRPAWMTSLCSPLLGWPEGLLCRGLGGRGVLIRLGLGVGSAGRALPFGTELSGWESELRIL